MKSDLVISNQELPAEVLQAIKTGSKIVAIKLLREATGLGLANAKVLVDRAAAKYADRSPPPSILETQGNGMVLGTILLLVTLLFAAYRLFLTG